MKRISFAASLVLLLGICTTVAFLALGDPGAKWCYVFQAYHWPGHADGIIDPPRDYHGLWRDWTNQGVIRRISLYVRGEKKFVDWFVEGNPYMRVSYGDGSGAACGYEYRFSATGDVTFVGTYLKNKPGNLIVIYHPSRKIDIRQKYPGIMTRYVPLSSNNEANQAPHPTTL